MTPEHMNAFFDDLVSHFRSRAEQVRSLAVMVANEHWFQMESAALLDQKREKYGIGGGPARTPDWWIACEYKSVDLWIQKQDDSRGVAIEFKAVHNNKNFWDKIKGIRKDLSKEKKIPPIKGAVSRYEIIVGTFAWYVPGHDDRYPLLTALKAQDFKKEMAKTLKDPDEWYDGLPLVKLMRWESICDLEDARYIDKGHGCGVWLGLAEAATDQR